MIWWRIRLYIRDVGIHYQKGSRLETWEAVGVTLYFYDHGNAPGSVKSVGHEGGSSDYDGDHAHLRRLEIFVDWDSDFARTDKIRWIVQFFGYRYSKKLFEGNKVDWSIWARCKTFVEFKERSAQSCDKKTRFHRKLKNERKKSHKREDESRYMYSWARVTDFNETLHRVKLFEGNKVRVRQRDDQIEGSRTIYDEKSWREYVEKREPWEVIYADSKRTRRYLLKTEVVS